MLDVVLLAVAQYKRIFDKMGEQYGVAYPGDVFPLLAARYLQGSAPSLDERMTGWAWHNNILSRPDANEKNQLCWNRRQQIAQTCNAYRSAVSSHRKPMQAFPNANSILT
ncbi:MAG: hypothetical protein Q8Q81_07180 [Oxalobacteraceae bacterium]|nr:hypothetical protein [Oxalobacteraceae bacterium]